MNMNMNTNQKGQIGLACVIKDLTEIGCELFLPIHDYSDVDLIALINGCTFRIQVKYRTSKNGRVTIPLYSVVNRRKIPIDRTMIDMWAVFCPEIETVLYIPIANAVNHKSEFSVRLTRPENTIQLNRCHSPDYTEFLNPLDIFGNDYA